MADDPTQSVADSQASSDPNIIPTPESASSPADRPVSTILADSPIEPKAPLADPATDYTAPVTILADSPVATESATISSSPVSVPTDSMEATSSAQPAESPPQSPADLIPPSPISPQSPSSPLSPPEKPSIPPVSSEASTPSPSSEATSGGSISVSSPPNEPSQVQAEAPVNAPSSNASQTQETPPQSAEIKPEPLEGTQEAPLADSETPLSPKTSFGDLVSGQPHSISPPVSPQLPQSPQAPISSPSSPKPSLGDLVGIPPVEQPTINIEPIEPPKPTQQPQPPPSPQSPDFSSKRQQALQTRRKKRGDHLAKILALVSQKGRIHNSDVRDTLRVSQSTASDYLQTLVNNGKIKREGKAKATVYLL